MPDFLPPWPLLLAFLGAALVLALTPGPAVLYIVARTLSQGRRAGLASVAGVALGNLMNAAVASLGLAVVLLASELAFAAIRYAGAAYLVWLGVQALRGPRNGNAAMPSPATVPAWRVFRQGAVVALLNPKTTLFFAAFLPQFIDPARGATAQALSLSALFVGIAACSDIVYVLLSRALARRWRPGRSGAAWGRFATAGIYFSLGALAAFSPGSASRTHTNAP
jgi:threonine/homoserine/homoserine lactone efflux protein